MGAKEFFRGAGLWLSKTLFVMLTVMFVASIAASNLTSESFLKPVIGEVIGAQTSGMPLGQQYQSLLDRCNREGTPTLNVPLETDVKNFTIIVDCGALRTNGEAEVKNIFKNQVSEAMFSDFYNKPFCSGFECINKLSNLTNPLDLVTADFNKFLKSVLWIIGGLALLFGLFVILLAKGLPGKFLSIGGSMITAGLPYFMIKFLEKNIGTMIPSEAAMAVPFLATLLNPIANIFLIVLIVGVVSCVVGWGIKIYRKQQEKKGKSSSGKSVSGKKK